MADPTWLVLYRSDICRSSGKLSAVNCDSSTPHGQLTPPESHSRGSVSPAGSAGELAAIFGQYMADLSAGKPPDKRRLLDDHPELATQLEACFAGVELIHRQRGKVLLGAAATAAATVLLIIGGFLSWRFYAEWRLGRIELINDGIALTGQVLSEPGDESIGEPFDLITRATVALPAGDYQLRLNGKGRLGRTYRFAVNRGETQAHRVSLEEGRLLRGEAEEPLPGEKRPVEQLLRFAPLTVALEVSPGKADLFEWTRESLVRRDGVTGKVVWDALRSTRTFDLARDPAD